MNRHLTPVGVPAAGGPVVRRGGGGRAGQRRAGGLADWRSGVPAGRRWAVKKNEQ